MEIQIKNKNGQSYFSIVDKDEKGFFKKRVHLNEYDIKSILNELDYNMLSKIKENNENIDECSNNDNYISYGDLNQGNNQDNINNNKSNIDKVDTQKIDEDNNEKNEDKDGISINFDGLFNIENIKKRAKKYAITTGVLAIFIFGFYVSNLFSNNEKVVALEKDSNWEYFNIIKQNKLKIVDLEMENLQQTINIQRNLINRGIYENSIISTSPTNSQERANALKLLEKEQLKEKETTKK